MDPNRRKLESSRSGPAAWRRAVVHPAETGRNGTGTLWTLPSGFAAVPSPWIVRIEWPVKTQRIDVMELICLFFCSRFWNKLKPLNCSAWRKRTNLRSFHPSPSAKFVIWINFSKIFFHEFICLKISGNAVPLDKFANESNISCKPRVEALVRLGEFIEEKQYEKDYIPLCTCHSTIEAWSLESVKKLWPADSFIGHLNGRIVSCSSGVVPFK